MKGLLTAVVTTVALSGTTNAADFTTRVKVTNVKALIGSFTTSIPYESCQTHKVWVEDQSLGNQLFGAILGGAIGNQIGKGSGKTIATAAGAIIGSQVVGANNNGHFEQKRVCETRYTNKTETVTSGYDVTFKVNGQEHTTILPERPGPYVTVRFNIESVE
jgi:uncharacterized protein YcfJ